MIQSLHSFDVFITSFIQRLLPHNSFFDLLFSFFSLRGMSVIIWMVILLLLIIFEEKINKKFIVYFILSIAIASIVVFVMKELIHRSRPSLQTSNFQLLTSNCPRDFSFPSGHAANAFAASAVLVFFDKKRRLFYFFVAGLIGLSRIYLGCHYILDVVGGGIIGCVISYSLLKLKK